LRTKRCRNVGWCSRHEDLAGVRGALSSVTRGLFDYPFLFARQTESLVIDAQLQVAGAHRYNVVALVVGYRAPQHLIGGGLQQIDAASCLVVARGITHGSSN